ncbi:MAG: HDOD domain-containing protein [Desulfobacterales bacterium]|nr:HDOD domain-containing protein [Desulfobacterales bacterium]
MKIMVVDDDAVSRKVLEKKLTGIAECTAVESGKKAVSLFGKTLRDKAPFDLIILDILMPDMDGIQTLSRLRKIEKKLEIKKDDRVKIIMITASMRKKDIKKCILLGCNAYIAKPFKTLKIYEEFERLGFSIPKTVKEDQKDQKSYTDLVTKIIKRFNKGEIELPVLPHIVKEIRSLLMSDDPSVEELTQIVQKDAVISAKLISVANSTVYQGVDKATTLNAALVRIGMKETLSVITSVTSKNLFNSDNDDLKAILDKLWLHSLACASCCKFLAEAVEDEPLESVFLMGIIHDIGKVLLLKAIADISPDEPLNDEALQAAVQEVHTVFGAVLVKKWGFAPEYQQAAERHHWDAYPKDAKKELLIVHIANKLVSAIGFPSSCDPEENGSKETVKPEISPAILGPLNIETEQIQEICDRVSDAMLNLSEQF